MDPTEQRTKRREDAYDFCSKLDRLCHSSEASIAYDAQHLNDSVLYHSLTNPPWNYEDEGMYCEESDDWVNPEDEL